MQAPTLSNPATLCRDCLNLGQWVERYCPLCGGRRLVRHKRLQQLSIAHIDCDAFYASVEKRDDPSLIDKPVIVGGSTRGVVSTACYIARLRGVRSAMPMFKALQLCPHAVVIKPNMQKYVAAAKQIRSLMQSLTPLVEGVSIDEAFLDLTGTDALHHASPAQTLAALAQKVEQQVGVTVSIGLSGNKFLAKLASEIDKPRGFAVLAPEDATSFLADKPLSALWGVGEATRKHLAALGLHRIGQLLDLPDSVLAERFGRLGPHLSRLARGLDDRPVEPHGEAKSISSETTFNTDIGEIEELSRRLWLLCEKLAQRLRKANLAARGVTLKLRLADFRLITRAQMLESPTQMAERLFQTAQPLLKKEVDGARQFRLIGIGTHMLATADEADHATLLDPGITRRRKLEDAVSALRTKMGDGAIVKGRSLPKSIK